MKEKLARFYFYTLKPFLLNISHGIGMLVGCVLISALILLVLKIIFPPLTKEISEIGWILILFVIVGLIFSALDDWSKKKIIEEIIGKIIDKKRKEGAQDKAVLNDKDFVRKVQVGVFEELEIVGLFKLSLYSPWRSGENEKNMLEFIADKINCQLRDSEEYNSKNISK